ncbi:hypothetical protein DCC85_17185 [Paenibacillus sp. CAA11]|nr:hypothetical protein DCC85_17185 [Paenibacillus sp. CAA11]
MHYKLMILTLAAVFLIAGCSSKSDSKNSNKDTSTNTTAAANTSAKDSKKTEEKDEGNVLKSSDDSIQITLPDGWKEDSTLNNMALIGASQRLKDKYVLVTPISKADMSDNATLEDFHKLFQGNIQISLQNYKEIETKDITIDSQPAKLIEFSGLAQNVKVHYLAALTSKGNSYYQIVTWSSEKKFDDSKEDFMKVIESFKVLKDTTATAPAASNSTTKTQTLKNSDDSIEVKVPSNWSTGLNLSPDADIQAAAPASEDYIVVLRESKTDFPDNVTLNDYYKVILDNMKGSMTNPEQTEPKQVTINGLKGMQYELTGEVDKIKISYLITILESDKNFTQVLLWTRANMMDQKRPGYTDIVNTFTEK